LDHSIRIDSGQIDHVYPELLTLLQPDTDDYSRAWRRFGQVLMQAVFSADDWSAYKNGAFNRLVLSVPPQFLRLPWQLLYDSHQFVALKMPLVVQGVTSQQADSASLPALPVRTRPLRILFTGIPSAQTSAEAALLENFRARHSDSVEILIEKSIRKRILLELLNEAQQSDKPYHIWHHCGPMNATPDGIALNLADQAMDATMVNRMLQRQNALAGIILSRVDSGDAAATRVPSGCELPFERLPLHFAITLTGTPAVSTPLLQHLYQRLLSYSVSQAVLLARLDSYIQDTGHGSLDWSAMNVVVRSPDIQLAAFPRSDPEPVRHKKIKVLFLTANPDDTARLHTEREIREIKDMVRGRGSVEFEWIWEGAVLRDQITAHLLEHKPHIVHFSGHGSKKTGDLRLLFEGRIGERKGVDADSMADLLAAVRETACFVVLNACYSVAHAQAISKVVPHVVGMNTSVTDDAAIVFACELYLWLAYGNNLAEAFQAACRKLGTEEHSDEMNTPQLYPPDSEAHQRVKCGS
jgi:hypothetical protein